MSAVDVPAAWEIARQLRKRAVDCLVAEAATPNLHHSYYPDCDVDLDFSAHLLIAQLLGEIHELRAKAKANR